MDCARQRTSRWPQRALKTLSGRTCEQPVERHAHVAFDDCRNAKEVALHGAAAVVQDVAGHPCGHGWLRASGGHAVARGAPQVPEGDEAKPRPERLQVRIDRPGAVVASEERAPRCVLLANLDTSTSALLCGRPVLLECERAALS